MKRIVHCWSCWASSFLSCLLFGWDQQIKFGYKFLDTLYPLANGDMLIDLTKFDLIEPDGVSVLP